MEVCVKAGEEAVAVAVAEGISASWIRGSVVGQAWDRQSAVLVTHPVAASDARP